jgi:hypothetical protein
VYRSTKGQGASPWPFVVPPVGLVGARPARTAGSQTSPIDRGHGGSVTRVTIDERKPHMAVSVNLDSLLDKAYESSSLQEILDAPVAALAGVSDTDAEALKSAFNIKTVGDLGKNKYFAAAVALADLSKAGAK